MTTLRSRSPLGQVLAQHEGRCLLSGPQAIYKGLFEAERGVSLVVMPRDEVFAPLLSLAQDEGIASLLVRHGMRVIGVPTARRAAALALQAARSGHGAVAMTPNDQLDVCAEILAQAGRVTLPPGGALGLVLEDDPAREPLSCPREAAVRAGLACIEPATVADLRDGMDHLLRLSRAGSCAAAMVVHRLVLLSSQTVAARANRIVEAVDAMLARQRPRPRSRLAETGGVLRMARRLELNQTRALPSPGERVPVGFITTGPADAALNHIAHELKLTGRLAVLRLGVLNPLDEAVIGRFLLRCEQVVVLEPRPGALKTRLLQVVEVVRRRGERPALLWGRTLPTGDDAGESALDADETLHPSRLARRIIHLLHLMRPGLHVASRLLPEPPATGELMRARGRGADVGPPAAMALLRRTLADLDQWLRDHAPYEERGIKRTALAIDGVEPAGRAERVVPVELFDGRQFAEAGLAALRQAAREDGPWILLVCDVETPADADVERLARAVIPSDRGERVTIATASFGNRSGLRERLEEAALAPGVTLLIVRDGQPAQFDLAAIERSLAEVDRLGYQPQQQLIWPADEVCAIRPPHDEEDEEEGEVSPTASMAGEVRPLETQFTTDRLTRRVPGRVRFRVQPLLEQIEVIRTRPPAWTWRRGGAPKLDLPEPRHARQAQWRFHQAGFRGGLHGGIRGGAPGPAALIIEGAGRNMDYDVSSVCDPSPIAPGRRAWVQVLYTQARGDETRTPITATAPYGEIDLLLGMDPQETLRAIGAGPLRIAHEDRTCAVVNRGAFHGDAPFSISDRERFTATIAAVSRPDTRMVEDFAAVCRAWFHTDRVADVAMIGVAYQMGLIPVSLEAIEHAVRRAEELGFGRSMEAFEFGRRLCSEAATHSRPLARPEEKHEEEVAHLARRTVLSVRHSRWGGASKARSFEFLLRQCLGRMPGLSETEPGRRARRDFVVGLYRCLEWGGAPYASKYAQLLIDLYQADRGDKGRSLTRNTVLPLAEVMLIRDPIYIACMATSPEQRRRVRRLLNIKPGRGDEIERRYLTRVELLVARRRFRADVRTSDWPARLARALRWVLPHGWRGTRRDRELRDYVIDLIERATAGAGSHYEQWAEAFARLHHHAEEDRLRAMALAELRMLAEPGAGGGGGPGEHITPAQHVLPAPAGSQST